VTGDGQVEIRQMRMTLSIDHRAVDGLLARFLAQLKDVLE
jgi:pyruvate/2-oxoglutarate dehydrogenase complex dihydrolipoamide acyltransferase (E2) component